MDGSVPPVIVDTKANTFLAYDVGAGTLRVSSWDDQGTVTTAAPYSVPCVSHCGGWYPIGRLYYPNQGYDAVQALAWHNHQTGVVGLWKLAPDGTVSPYAPTLGETANANDWKAVATADFTGDGNTDILWYDMQTGQLACWPLFDDEEYYGIGPNFLLSWTCGPYCQSLGWNFVDAADVNGDGHTDLLWHNPLTGDLSAWLLDGNGKVMDKALLSKGCGYSDGCADSWEPVGFVSFP
jgi:hypothetical protein